MAADAEVGESIPPLTAHAVSVSLPTWRANVSYEEGHEWVISKMKTGYPRFFIHKSIARLANALLKVYGQKDEQMMIFPSSAVAMRFQSYLCVQVPGLNQRSTRILDLIPKPTCEVNRENALSWRLSAVIFPNENFTVAKSFWQHTGEGISSRRAEYCYRRLEEGLLIEQSAVRELQRTCKGPKRYSKGATSPERESTKRDAQSNDDDLIKNGEMEQSEQGQYIEERFGRNLGLSMAQKAKVAVRRRIAGSLSTHMDSTQESKGKGDMQSAREAIGVSEDDVFLYPTGMSAIYNTHRTVMAARGRLESITYGFPYVDTLKIVEKFGPGCLFYGHGSSEDLDDLQRRLEGGEKYLALFCEFPGNPLLTTPDLHRIWALAAKYDFVVVVDETIGNFLNVNVLPFADVVVSSLTKVFSGDSNVMGGSAILNPQGLRYQQMKLAWAKNYEDNLWPEDAIFLERNSRDFASRIERINKNAEAVAEVLHAHQRVKQVHYPKYSTTRVFYDMCRTPGGGYGGLLSATFHTLAEAAAFYDSLETSKGPSLGTNFTLSSPYVILAHYTELEWAARYGVETSLVRFSIGLEHTANLTSAFRRALNAIEDGVSS